MVVSDEIKNIREKAGMTRKEFAEYFGIPYRTLQDWELGNRTIQGYLLRLMVYRLTIEGKIAIDSEFDAER